MSACCRPSQGPLGDPCGVEGEPVAEGVGAVTGEEVPGPVPSRVVVGVGRAGGRVKRGVGRRGTIGMCLMEGGGGAVGLASRSGDVPPSPPGPLLEPLPSPFLRRLDWVSWTLLVTSIVADAPS